MVLTRAQARAQAAAVQDDVENDGDMEIDGNDDGEIDNADADHSAALVVADTAATTSVHALGPSVKDHVTALAQQFLLKTQVLAREHAALQFQQEGQKHAQNAALMAVKASTETSVRQLTDQQRDIAVKLGEALTATQASLWEQLQQLQKVQDERGGQIESYVRARLTQAIQDVQKETRDSQMVIVCQTDEIRQNLALMERNVDGTLSQMIEHVQKLIEDKLVGRNLAEETSQIVQQQLEKSTDHVAATVMEHVRKLVDDKLAMSQGRTSLTQEAAQIIQQQMERSTEGIAAEVMDHAQQLVEGKLAVALRGSSRNHEMSEMVKHQVEIAMEGVSFAMKSSVELDLQKACNSIHDELLRCACDVDGPLYESFRGFVTETTMHANRHLEARIQKLLMNTQSEVNLQVQRQADATVALREHVNKKCARIEKQSQQSECVGLESTIASLVKKEVDLCINALQGKDPRSGDDSVRQEAALAGQPKHSQYSIEHSLQTAIEAVCKTIKESIRELTSVDELQRSRTTHYEPNWSSDGEGVSDSDRDSEFEKNMLEAWEKSYRHAPRPASPVELPNTESRRPSNLDDESKVPVASARGQLHTAAMVHTTLASSAETQTENQAPQTLQTTSPPLMASPERCISNRMVVVRPTSAVAAGTRASSQTEEYHGYSPPLSPTSTGLERFQPLRGRARAPARHTHHRARAHKQVALSVLVSDLQLQVQMRAEQTAQRYLSSSGT